VRAIVLAAGRGSRLGAIGDQIPKCLVRVGGQPLLTWQLDALRAAGIREIAVVVGYRADQVKPPTVTRFENRRWSETNMVASLMCASSWLEADDCVVSYADIVYPASVVAHLAQADADVAITFDVNWRRLWETRFGDPLRDAETFRCDADGYVVEIGRQPGSIEDVQGQYMGLLKFSPQGWRRVRELVESLPMHEQNRLHMTGMLQRLITSGTRVLGVAITDSWWECDSAEDVRLCEAELAAGRLTLR
jgi:choline kinase